MAKPKTVTSLYLVPADRRVLEKAAKKAGLPLTVFIKRCALRFAEMMESPSIARLVRANGVIVRGKNAA